MTATASLRMRAESITADVRRKISAEGGEISGSIREISREMGYTGNNEVREALGSLCRSGQLSGTPLDAISIGLPAKKYLYRINPSVVLLVRLGSGMIDRCGTASDVLEELGMTGAISPAEFDEIILGLNEVRIIAAPRVMIAGDGPRSQNTYLYLDLIRDRR